MPQILLVEDSPTQAAATSILLEESGFGVHEVRSGELALQALNDSPIDLVLTDVTLGGMTGIDLCREIRGNSAFDALPVVVLTGNQDVHTVLRSLEAGATAYLPKACEPQQLIDTVNRTLDSVRQNEPPIRKKVKFQGESFVLTIPPTRLLNLMLETFQVLAENRHLNRRHDHHHIELGSASSMFVLINDMLDIAQTSERSAAATASPKPAPAATASGTPPQPLHILLVEDSPTNQTLATLILEAQGHTVDVAGNGVIAVEKNAAGRYDLILMDIEMPELDGLEATARIREQERVSGGHTPIIAMTAMGKAGDRERCLAAGMDDYVTKPIQNEALFAALTRIQNAASGESAAGSASAASTGPGAGPLVDRAAALVVVGGDEALLASVIDAARVECPAQLEQLSRALRDQDARLVQRSAHTIKGAMRIFAADSVTALAQEIEDLGAASTLSGIESRVERLGQLVQQALAAL